MPNPIYAKVQIKATCISRKHSWNMTPERMQKADDDGVATCEKEGCYGVATCSQVTAKIPKKP